jgi:hypothetical protein
LGSDEKIDKGCNMQPAQPFPPVNMEDSLSTFVFPQFTLLNNLSAALCTGSVSETQKS